MKSTYLPSDGPEGVDVACLCTLGIGEPKTLRVEKLRSSAIEEPANVDPRRAVQNRDRSEASNMDASTGVDEDILLGTNMSPKPNIDGEGSYNLEVPMNDVERVYTLHAACYSQQLM